MNKKINRFKYYLEVVQQEKYLLNNQESLNEMNLDDVKTVLKKTASIALVSSMPFLPIAKNLYGQSSCTINSAGETISCNADKLKSQRSTNEILKDIRYGINIIKKDIKNPKFKDFVKDDIKFAEKGLQDLLDRVNQETTTDNKKEKIKEIEEEIKIVNNLKKEIKA